MHAIMFFFLFNEFYKSTYKFKVASRRALEKKLKEMQEAELCNAIKANGNSVNGVNGSVNGINGSLNQYLDSVNHNHINTKASKEHTDSYYSNGNANGTTELINRKK